MQKAKRTIYKLTGESFEIECEEKHIKEIINLIMQLKMEEDPDMEYCKFGDPQSNNYIIFSLKMLEQQKNDAEKQKKENDEKEITIKKLEKQINDFMLSREALNCSNQLKTDRDALLDQKKEIIKLKKSNLELQTMNEKLQNDLKNEKKDKKDLEKNRQELMISTISLKEESNNRSQQLELISKKNKSLEGFQESKIIEENKMLKQELCNQKLKYERNIEKNYANYQSQLALEVEEYKQKINDLQAELNQNSDKLSQRQNDQLIFIYNELVKENQNLNQHQTILYENQQNYEKQIQILNDEIQKLKLILKNFYSKAQLNNFTNNIINFKLSEIHLNLNNISDLSLISQANLSESLIKEFSEEEFIQALKETIFDKPFQSQILQLPNLQLELKKKQANEYKFLTQSQIKDQILNNLLCFQLIQKYVQEKKNQQQEISIFDDIRIPKQFIIEGSNGNYFYCEELIEGDNMVCSINRNNSEIEKLFKQFFIYCYQNTGKKRIFTQLCFNQNDKLVSNVIGYDISISPFKVKEVLAQLCCFNQLLNQSNNSKVQEITILEQNQLDM